MTVLTTICSETQIFCCIHTQSQLGMKTPQKNTLPQMHLANKTEKIGSVRKVFYKKLSLFLFNRLFEMLRSFSWVICPTHSVIWFGDTHFFEPLN